MPTPTPQLFALDATRAFGRQVADALQLPLSDHRERDFEDGEHKVRPLVNVRGRDVFVIQSLYGDAEQSVNDKLCRLLFFLGALRDAAAERVTAVVPYLCYGRKDRKTQPRDPVTTRYVAQLFEAVGADRVITMDAHNIAAFQNAFRCRTDHLEARNLFVNHFAARLDHDRVTVVSPDVGGIKRAEHLREGLSRVLGTDVPSAFIEKKRAEDVVSGGTLVGDVKGRAVIIVDDLISTGTTTRRAIEACHNAGASAIYVAATHGLFVDDAPEHLTHEALDHVAVTNSIPPFRLDGTAARDKLIVLNAAGLCAEAIRCVHTNGSIADLLAI